MIAIRLEKEMEQELDLLAKTLGSNRNEIVREAIYRYLEDSEDLALAKNAQKVMRGSKSLQQLRKEIGLSRNAKKGKFRHFTANPRPSEE